MIFINNTFINIKYFISMDLSQKTGDVYSQKELLEKGYAQIATYPPNVRYVEEFKKVQKQAREEKVGFWAEDIFQEK